MSLRSLTAVTADLVRGVLLVVRRRLELEVRP